MNTTEYEYCMLISPFFFSLTGLEEAVQGGVSHDARATEVLTICPSLLVPE